jgi:hypothetical protein
MVKSKLIPESELNNIQKDHDETITDIPSEIPISEDKMIAKLNSVIKGSKKKTKQNKNTIPTTQNSFADRRSAVDQKQANSSANPS